MDDTSRTDQPTRTEKPAPTRGRTGRRTNSSLVLILAVLAACLALLANSWLRHRSLEETTDAIADLNRIAAQINGLQDPTSGEAPRSEDPPITSLQSIRRDLNNLIFGPGCPQALQETLVRSDTLLTQALRALAGPDGISHRERIKSLLGEASDLLIHASLQLQSQADRQFTTDRKILAITFLLVTVVFAMILTLLGLKTMRAAPIGPLPDSAAFPLLLAAAVRNTDEGVLITDTGMKIGEPMILFANDSFKAMSGFPERQLVGQPLRMLRTTCLREKEFSLLEHSFSNSKSATMETIRWKEDGSKVYCEWHISPVREEEGKVTHFISILMDVTRLREQEEAQRRSKEELMEAHQRLMENQQQLIHSEKMAFLGQLAAGVAHEINNPVGYVMSNLETLIDDIKEIQDTTTGGQAERADSGQLALDPFFSETQEILLESITGLERVKDIVQGLKNFARPAESEIKAADINHEIEVALKIVSNELGHKCTVVKNLGDLPSLKCRPGQLNQVFANLLANAAQAIADRGTITVTTESTPSEILIKVADDGVGIEKENLSLLFTPFFTTKPTGQGTGLGLSVSYGIIQKHNGTIEVETHIGQGSTFTVHLPIPEETVS